MSFHSTSIDRRLTPSHISFISYKQAVEDSQWNEVTVKDSHPQPTGNYIVAAHNIKRNTTVITENPFIRQLNVEHQKTHCQYCFKKIQRKVVCRNSECNWSLLYCSSPCENSYWLTGHKWLCRFPELSSLHRDVLLAFQGYIQCRTLYSVHEQGIPDLVSNINMHNDLQIQEYKDRIGILTHAFHLSSSDIDTLINIQAQIRCNSFAVKQSQLNNATSNVLVSHEYVNRGRAVYLKASLINHSCSPNAIALFGDHDNPTTVSIKTIDPILLNEEVCISYGPLATQHARKERKEKLQNNYFFDCSCSACQQSKKDTFETVYKCQYCETGQLYKEQERCASCQKKADWNYYSKIEAQLDNDKSLSLNRELELKERIYHKYAFTIAKTLDQMAQLSCNSRRIHDAVEYTKRSLDIVKHVFGNTSLEAAEEMMKLSTLLFNAMMRKQALTQINETIKLYKILGLSEHEQEDMRTLYEMKRYLTC